MRAAISIAFWYAVLAGLYLIGTHALASDWVRDDPDRLEAWREIKGGISLMVSTGLVFVLAFRFAHQRKRAIQRLEDSLLTFQQLFDASPFPSWVYGADSMRVFAVNGAALIEYGYTREEFLRLTTTALHPVDELEKFRVFAINMSSFPSVSQWRQVRKDNSPLETELTVSSITFGGEDARLVVAQNISNRRRAERVLGEVLSLRPKTPPAPPSLAAALVMPREIKPFLQGIVDECLVAAIRSGIKLNLEMDSSMPASFVLEEERLEKALKILVGHAVKFARARSVSLRVRLSLGASRMEFSVCEEDGGFPERTFSTPHDVSPPSYPGADLLAAEQICELLGATLRVDDRPRHFVIQLPGQIDAAGIFRAGEKPPQIQKVESILG